MCYIENGDWPQSPVPDTGGENLSYFYQFVDGWSFHDYDDVADSYNCTPSNTSACVSTEAADMLALMANSGARDGTNVWLTEAGCRDYQTSPQLCANLSQTQQGNEAYGWTRLLGYINLAGYSIQHAIWYEWDLYQDTGPTEFDSAILDANYTPREIFCVLGSAGSSWTYWNNTSCTGH